MNGLVGSLGSVAGGLYGLMLAGPYGAILGGGIGNWLIYVLSLKI
jgi:hypothetical protein